MGLFDISTEIERLGKLNINNNNNSTPTFNFFQFLQDKKEELLNQIPVMQQIRNTVQTFANPEELKQETEVSIKDNEKLIKETDAFSKVYNFWIKKGLKKAGALALATICKFESGFKPASVEKSEKAGKGYGVARNNTSNQQGYGVGLYAWTGGQHKEKALRAGGYDPSKVKIENLSFDQQLELAYAEFSKNYDKTWNTLKNTTDLKTALNIAYAYLSAGSKNSSEAPSDSYCQTLAYKYMLTHAKLGYKKASRTNGYEARLNWMLNKAKELK